MRYLRIMLVGLVPYALAQIYASTLRETGETVAPMRAGIVAVATNTVLDYVLIFGKFGMRPGLLAWRARLIGDGRSRAAWSVHLIVSWTHQAGRDGLRSSEVRIRRFDDGAGQS